MKKTIFAIFSMVLLLSSFALAESLKMEQAENEGGCGVKITDVITEPEVEEQTNNNGPEWYFTDCNLDELDLCVRYRFETKPIFLNEEEHTFKYSYGWFGNKKLYIDGKAVEKTFYIDDQELSWWASGNKIRINKEY